MGLPVPPGIVTNISPTPGTPPNAMRRLMGAMSALEKFGEVAAHNAANMESPGFKQQVTNARQLQPGIPTAGATVDWSPGAVRLTEQPLDFALTGPGFLVVGTPAGPRLTRGGAFQLDGERRVVSAYGEPLLAEPSQGRVGEDGVVRVPAEPGQLEVLSDGRLLFTPLRGSTGGAPDPVVLGRLRLERPDNLGTLLPEAGGRWRPTAPTIAITGDARRILRSGAIEESNTNAVSTMATLVETNRRYSSVQQAASILDHVRGLMATEIAKPPQ
jgi:flagellar basal body rod protein FlgG